MSIFVHPRPPRLRNRLMNICKDIYKYLNYFSCRLSTIYMLNPSKILVFNKDGCVYSWLRGIPHTHAHTRSRSICEHTHVCVYIYIYEERQKTESGSKPVRGNYPHYEKPEFPSHVWRGSSNASFVFRSLCAVRATSVSFSVCLHLKKQPQKKEEP